jgi:hypothetical protein
MLIRGRKALFASSLVIVGIIIFGLGALSAKAFLTRNGVTSTNANSSNHASGPLLIEGFDFKRLRSANNDWRGPEIGEKIDLTRLRMKDGKALASMVGPGPIMVVAVSPSCAMCTIASDEMSHLREKLSTMTISYYLISFAPPTPQVDFFKYIDSLNVGAPGFLWNTEGGAPPESMFVMTTPTHLLLNSDGTVIHVWPGSYQEKAVRQRMARQIVADTSVAMDTLNALAPQHPASTRSQAR